jgi:hypothetical protein
MVYSKKARLNVPDCGGTPTVPLTNKNATAVHDVPKPWSPQDNSTPLIAVYYSATPIVDWHAAVVKPGVVIRNETDGFIGWGTYAAIGVDSLLVVFTPSAAGGTLTARMDLEALGHASAWLNGPCGVRLDVITASLTATGQATATLTVTTNIQALQLKSVFTVSGNIDKGSINISTGGLLGPIIGEVVEWLIKIGALRVDSTFSERGETVLSALERLEIRDPVVFQRVAEQSVLFGLVENG